MISLKEDDTFAVLDANGAALSGPEGFFRHDTRFLRRYRWDLPQFRLCLSHSPHGGELRQHWAIFAKARQEVAIRRTLRLRHGGFDDHLLIENTEREPRRIELRLEVEGDFADLFVVRGWRESPSADAVQRTATPDCELLHHVATDGVASTAELVFVPARGPDGSWVLELGPRESVELRVTASLDGGLASATDTPDLPHIETWRGIFAQDLGDDAFQRAYDRAVDDLRALLMRTEHGLYPAAGIPWYVCAFGRDALLTAGMMLPWGREVAAGVLDYLAAHQGRVDDPFREEQPGKILHEVRRGELSRTGRVPFARYYGTVDATPLFLVLLDDYHRATGDDERLRRLRPAWTAALEWLARHEAEEGGLIRFLPSGSGLVVQSWKDSFDSMSHAGGELAEAPLAVAEVQGYAYAAYCAAARFHGHLGEEAEAALWAGRAERLREGFHRRFWLEDRGTYAMALDRHDAPLRVLSSDAGHLLWSGIVPEEVAPRLVRTLMSPTMFTGWGLRTLGAGEVRYNPLSYHNGSVWPHDTAIFAGGLARYGFARELGIVARGLVDLANSQSDLRLPELIGGYPRSEGAPVPYLEACRPQAWSAAAMIYLARLRQDVPFTLAYEAEAVAAGA